MLAVSQNIEELFSYIIRFGIFASCIQETWRFGVENLQNENCLLLLSGLNPDIASKRGSQGVGIVLSGSGVDSWQKAGCEIHNISPRVIAIRMMVQDTRNRDIFVFLISAYAPVSSESDAVWEAYYDELEECMQRMRAGDVLLIGTDSNASVGTRAFADEDETAGSGPLGPHGISHVNKSGRRFRSFLATNNLVATSTFFKKKNYGTWQHPRSKRLHQLDHFITKRKTLKLITDSGITTPMLYSDHQAVRCKMNIQLRLKQRLDTRERLVQLDYSSLSEENTAVTFCSKVLNNIDSGLTDAMTVAAQETLAKKPKKQPGWFKENESTLLPLIEARNAAVAQNFGRKMRSKTEKVRLCRKNLKRAVAQARDKWIIKECEKLNENVLQQRGTKPAWDAVGKLKAGLSKTKPSTVKNMKKTDGSACQTPEENAEVFRNHFHQLFSREPDYDASVLDLLDQQPVVKGLDGNPTEEEIKEAINHLRNTAPGDSGLCAQAYKCLMKNGETFTIIKGMVLDFWRTGLPPSEWEMGILKILPKKGDLALPGNHRGIMLLEIAYKIIANLLRKRLLPIQETLDHESQCGFRPGRGCSDAVFTIKMALKKRQEHGLESWVLFLDLVKAFDRVPRQLLWDVLLKFGVPQKLVKLLRSLHESVLVKFKVQEITHIINSIIGVKQGDILGPMLFTFYAAAVMITWRIVSTVPACIFRTKEDYISTGRSYRAYGEDFELADSEYADDTAVLFDTRESIDVGVPEMITHFARFGMEVHTGNVQEEKESKTVILFCSKSPHLYDDSVTYDNMSILPTLISEMDDTFRL